ncbi:MAG TPA: aldo/keto reductase [Spirochaetia bacterium]|nr:aldo/keto reductase [Spirochaetia bacterium]
MEYTNLGTTDITLSRITHGCMELGGMSHLYWEVKEEEVNVALLQTALDNGVTTFDTAESYGDGRSETIVGKALKKVRSRCTIASKVAKEHLMPDDIQKALEGSLKRLDTSYIDLYYIHWPNNDIPLEKTVTKLMQLKDQGVIKSIGVSNFSLAQLTEAVKYGEISAYQPEYNLLSRGIEKEIMPFCREHKISILSYNSLAKGILTGAFHLYGAKLEPKDFRNAKPHFQNANMRVQERLIQLLEEVAKKHGATVSQIATSWTIAQPGMTSAIIGTQNQKHFLENIRAIEIKLTEDETKEISGLSDQVIQEMTL